MEKKFLAVHKWLEGMLEPWVGALGFFGSVAFLLGIAAAYNQGPSLKYSQSRDFLKMLCIERNEGHVVCDSGGGNDGVNEVNGVMGFDVSGLLGYFFSQRNEVNPRKYGFQFA